MRSFMTRRLASKRKRSSRSEGGVGVAHVLTGECPLVEGGAPVEAAMRGLVILPLDPSPEAAIECVEALRWPWRRDGRARRRERF